ncbi:hypothetical protein OROGR_032240 [Orobanche gracilis]
MDSYALCRVFKKNGLSPDVDQEQGQSSNISLLDYMQFGAITEHTTMSPDFSLASSSNNICMEEEEEEEEEDDDKDDSWMQFITDDVWCSSSTNFGGEEVPQLAFY